MTTTDIEEIAVDEVKRELRKHIGMFQPYINNNDKTPFWDGEIWIYDGKDKTKKDFTGRISVQIKGTTVKKIGKGNSKYSIDVEFLRGYQKDKKGTLLFVVEMIVEDELVKKMQIYYANLLPVDLEAILRGIEDKQKHVTINIKPIKEGTSSSIKFICLNFLKNSNMQFNIPIKTIEEIKDIERIEFGVKCDTQYLSDYLVKNDIYTYAITKNNEKVALPKILELTTAVEENYNVTIENKIYYKKVKVIKAQNYEYLLFGKATKVYLDTNKVEIKLQGNLYERIQDIEFILELLEFNYIKVDNKKLDFNMGTEIKEKTQFLEEIKQNKIFLDRAYKTFEYFKIRFDVDFKNLTDKDFENIDFLANLLEGKFPRDLIEDKLYHVLIGKYKIVFLIITDKNQKKKLYNFFEDLSNVLCVRYKEIPISIYINLKENDFIEISNLDTDVIKDTFINISRDSEIINIVNLYSLEIIKAYDKTKNFKLLELAEFINAKILDVANEDYIILNRIQIAYRKGSLSEKDKDELYDIRDRNKEIKIQLAIAILLNNQNDCKRYISKLNDKELKEIQDYPIWSILPKELIK